MNPKISVIFPVGDREAYLAEALSSVLAQTFADFELLVVFDDGRRLPMLYPESDAMFRADFVRQHVLRYDASFIRDEDHQF